MFYIYHYYRSDGRTLTWELLERTPKFTSTQFCEFYLKRLGYSLMEICRDFCFRWFPARPAWYLREPKSRALYPELRDRKGVKFIGR